MIVKKYTAGSLALAMKKVQAELGHEAVILSTNKKKKSGLFSLFKKQSYEIVAAIENRSKYKENQYFADKTVTEEKQLGNFESINVNNNHSRDSLMNEMKELKQMIGSVNKNIDSHLPNQIKQIKTMLQAQEIERETVDALIEFLLKKWYKEVHPPAFSTMRNWVQEYLHNQLRTSEFEGIRNETKYVFLFGPTGVGKTTTIAKLAAAMLLKKKKTVAFITLDTYRIAAVEQLKTYANILEAPLKVCYNRSEFEQAKLELREYDLVFIDTAGRNFFEKQYVDEVESFFSFSEQCECFLVMAATAKYGDMLELLKKFEKYPIDKLIVTKTDETRFLGSVFNICLRKNMKIAYVTNGQNVPEDIVETNVEKLVEMIVGGM